MSELHGGGAHFVSEFSEEKVGADNSVTFFDAGSTLDLGVGMPISITLSGPAERVGGRHQPARVSVLREDNEFRSSDTIPLDLLERIRNAKLYDKIVDNVNPSSFSTKSALIELAGVMQENGQSNAVSGMPGIFTYFGQFIAHDITHMRKNPDDPLDVINFRSHAFDLDSLFDPSTPIENPQNNVVCAGNLCVGSTREFDTIAATHDDLPRSASGSPCLPEKRNDNNLAVSQLTVAIIKFHQIVSRLRSDLADNEIKRITRQHIQSIALHDYLPRLINNCTYLDTINHGRKVIYPGILAPDFRLSIEFAAGCFRFGHSIVRDEYRWGENAPGDGATLRQILRLTHLDGISNRKHHLHARLRADWVGDLKQLLIEQFRGDTTHLSSAVDATLSRALQDLKVAWFDSGNLPPGVSRSALRLSLAQVTLLRGLQQKLPSAQTLYDHIITKSEIPEKHFGRLLGADEIKGKLPDRSGWSLLWQHTPLWFYTLREAEILGNKGANLGPVAGLVVMETVHAAIAASEDSILSKQGIEFEVLPEFRKSGLPDDKFSLERLLETVSENWPIDA